MRKLYKRIENYWGTEGDVGQTIWLTLFSLTVASFVAFFICRTVSAVVFPPRYMDYDKVFREDAPKVLIAQDNLGELYQVNLKTGVSESLGISADILSSDNTNGKNYALKILDKRLDVEILNGTKKEENFSIEFSVSDKEKLQVKVLGNSMFLFEAGMKRMTQIDLEKQDIVKEHILELDSEIIDWEVYGEKLFLATSDKLTIISLETMLQENEIEWDGLDGLSINNGILTLIDEPEELGFLTQFDAEDLEFVDSIAFDSTGAGLIDSPSNEPYVYFYNVNNQGGISVQVLDVKKSNEFLVDLNLKNVNRELHFARGYAYYVNKDDKGVVFSPKGKETLFELSEGVKKIIPIY